jgi:hypothetical protein
MNALPVNTRARLLAIGLAAAAAFCAAVPTSAPAQPLTTGFSDFQAYCCDPAEMKVAFEHSRAAGTKVVRLNVSWDSIAPSSSRPMGFDPRNPADPNYYWVYLDLEVRLAVEAGLEPILSVADAPPWAEGSEAGFPKGTRHPDAGEYGAFAEALARRYSGNFGYGLPRVRYYQAWNETNIFRFLNPQFEGQRPPTEEGPSIPASTKALSPGIYRTMLNAFSAGVHSVNADNWVITGGLSPFGRYRRNTPAVPPMRFMRELLCINKRNRPVSGCDPVSFDAWSMHPYTNGAPDHPASVADNVSIHELPQMRAVLKAAVRADHVVSSRAVGFWVTEISWNTHPPTPGGISLAEHARWVSEALYRMWKSGVSVVTWFGVRDGKSIPPEFYGSGVYKRCANGPACDKKKPSFTAYRFPFVALPSGRKARVWGRTPTSTGGSVRIERKVKGKWRRVTTLRANGSGIFGKTLRIKKGSSVRARFGNESSRPFTVELSNDHLVNPFG